MSAKNNISPQYHNYIFQYTLYAYNLTAYKDLDWRNMMSMFTCETQDIVHLRYSLLEPVYYHDPDIKYPDDKMLPSWFLRIYESTGDMMPYHIRTKY